MSTSAPAAAQEEKSEKVRLFRITDIPDVMDTKLGWKVGAQLMRRWFANPAYTLTQDEKTNRADPRHLSAFHLDERIVTMKWVMGFSRVSSAYYQLLSGWQTPAGLAQLKRRVIAAQPPMIPLGMTRWRFGDLSLPGKDLDKTFQVNVAEVGSLLDPLDDFFGGVARGLLKIAVSGLVTPLKNGRFQVIVDEVGIYLRDTYDFNDDSYDLISQPLGYWGFQGVQRDLQLRWDIEIDEQYVDKDEAPVGRFYAVQNDDFRRYRDKYGKGGDFILYSDVRRERLIKPLVLEI
ncbi:MAG: hypothetical protein HY308_09325 [Gammaproteobacteria bacterium]|nr:hypothetical protein [Gammaproteobacteria bacterium]